MRVPSWEHRRVLGLEGTDCTIELPWTVDNMAFVSIALYAQDELLLRCSDFSELSIFDPLENLPLS